MRKWLIINGTLFEKLRILTIFAPENLQIAELIIWKTNETK